MTFVWRDGSRLTEWMLYVLSLLEADLYARFGVWLLVTSGIRTYEEQVAIFLERYVTADQVNGRWVYDTRVWNGVRWYRISPAGTVAVPGTSNHEIQGDVAAVDLRDSGSGPGISSAGSERSNWLRANAHNYGLIPSGFNFDEAWHYDVLNIFATPPSAPEEPTENAPTLEDLMSLKSAVIVNGDTAAATALDFDEGFKTDWGGVPFEYSQTMGRILTDGGAVIVTGSHYDKLLKDHSAFFAARHQRALEVAKAGAR